MFQLSSYSTIKRKMRPARERDRERERERNKKICRICLFLGCVFVSLNPTP